MPWSSLAAHFCYMWILNLLACCLQWEVSGIFLAQHRLSVKGIVSSREFSGFCSILCSSNDLKLRDKMWHCRVFFPVVVPLHGQSLYPW